MVTPQLPQKVAVVDILVNPEDTLDLVEVAVELAGVVVGLQVVAMQGLDILPVLEGLQRVSEQLAGVLMKMQAAVVVLIRDLMEVLGLVMLCFQY